MSVVPVVSKTLLSVCPASSLSSTTSVGRAGLSVWISSTSSATAPLSHKYTHTPIVCLLSYFKTTRKFLQHRHGGNRLFYITVRGYLRPRLTGVRHTRVKWLPAGRQQSKLFALSRTQHSYGYLLTEFAVVPNVSSAFSSFPAKWMGWPARVTWPTCYCFSGDEEELVCLPLASGTLLFSVCSRARKKKRRKKKKGTWVWHWCEEPDNTSFTPR